MTYYLTIIKLKYGLTLPDPNKLTPRSWIPILSSSFRNGLRDRIDDDLGGLVGKMKQADAVIFATPVYYSDLSESLRAFTDRLRRTCTHKAGRAAVEGKPAIGICVAGGGGGGAPACCVSLEKVLATCGFDVVDTIPVRRQNLQAKLKTLEMAGQWLASKPGAGQ